jgi:hypothetical protein
MANDNDNDTVSPPRYPPVYMDFRAVGDLEEYDTPNQVDEIEKTLLPYLAMGFTIQNPKSRSAPKYGFEALRCSFNAVRSALKLGNNELEGWNTNDKWYKKFKGEGYKSIIKDQAMGLDDDYDFNHQTAESEREVLGEWCDDKKFLKAKQLRYLLEFANTEYGTEFQLGYIMEGFRGRNDSETGVYDPDFLQPTTISVQPRRLTGGPLVVRKASIPSTILTVSNTLLVDIQR